MRRRTIVALGCAAAVLGGVFAYGLTHQDDAAPGVRGLDPTFHRYAAPALPRKTLDGKPFSLQKLRGRPVVLNFWASWCVPCKEEAPQLAQVARDYAGRAQLVGVDVTDHTDKALRFARSHGWRYPIVAD